MKLDAIGAVILVEQLREHSISQVVISIWTSDAELMAAPSVASKIKQLILNN